jgi:DNA-binding transcriptional ArsR family regulator
VGTPAALRAGAAGGHLDAAGGMRLGAGYHLGMTDAAGPSPERRLKLLTNHGAALVWLTLNPDSRLAVVAERIGVSTRSAQVIVNDLVTAGLVTRRREGRRSLYSVDPEQKLREGGWTRIADFVAMVPDDHPWRDG